MEKDKVCNEAGSPFVKSISVNTSFRSATVVVSESSSTTSSSIALNKVTGSFTGSTVSVNVSSSAPSLPSSTVTSISALPFWFDWIINVNVPVLSPVLVVDGIIKLESKLIALNVRFWPSVKISTSVAVRDIVIVLSSTVTWSPITNKTGTSLTAVTVIDAVTTSPPKPSSSELNDACSLKLPVPLKSSLGLNFNPALPSA